MSAHIDVTPWLEKLESAIEPDWEREKLAAWKRLLAFEPPGKPFPAEGARPGGREPRPGEWPRFLINDAIRDPRKMLLRELGAAWDAVCRRAPAMLNIRANLGTGILPSTLGGEIFWMEDALDTLPTARPGEGDALGRLLAAGEPDIRSGQGGQVFDLAAYFQQALAPYPRIREAVWIYHPDLQGPVDVLELLIGSRMFLDFLDRPDDVKAALDRVTRTYERFMERWLAQVPDSVRDGYSAHWGLLIKGGVALRDDSLVNLSPAIHAEFVRPYDDRLLARFGGGMIHFCGRGVHCVPAMAESPALHAVHVSQPHLNDMTALLATVKASGKFLYVARHRNGLDGLDLSADLHKVA